jgi:hypothetical protein
VLKKIYNASAVKIYNASAVKIYNASAVKIYIATISIVRFENKHVHIFFDFEISALASPSTPL